MEARQKRMLLAAGGILVAIGAVVLLVRESSTPMARKDDSSVADAEADAEAKASANADASANANANANAEADASANAATAMVADGGARGTGREAGTGDSVTSASDAGEAGAARPKVVSIDESSEGKTVELAVGQSLVALLGANPTTGFDWAVIKAPAALGQPEMGFVSGGDQIGAPGKRRLTWTLKSALPAGDHTIELGYARSFEKGVPPFKTFKFKVRPAH
jgi:predicted secreted protein